MYYIDLLPCHNTSSFIFTNIAYDWLKYLVDFNFKSRTHFYMVQSPLLIFFFHLLYYLFYLEKKKYA